MRIDYLRLPAVKKLKTSSVCSPLLDSVHHSPFQPDCLYGIRAVLASVYRGIPLDIILFYYFIVDTHNYANIISRID